jgi:hypothetical protein
MTDILDQQTYVTDRSSEQQTDLADMGKKKKREIEVNICSEQKIHPAYYTGGFPPIHIGALLSMYNDDIQVVFHRVLHIYCT